MRPQHNADRTDRGPDITRTKSVSAQAGHVGSAKWPRSEPIDPAHRPSAAAASYLETVDGQFSTSERRIAVSARWAKRRRANLTGRPHAKRRGAGCPLGRPV